MLSMQLKDALSMTTEMTIISWNNNVRRSPRLSDAAPEIKTMDFMELESF